MPASRLMSQPFPTLPPVRTLTAIACLAMLLAAALWGIVRHGIDVKTEIDALAYANSDSQQWALAQLDVELGQLDRALLRYDPSDPDAPAADPRTIFERFDIFYSRIATITEGQSYQPLMARADVERPIARIRSFLDETADLIDTRPETLPEARTMLLRQIDQLTPDVRSLTLAGLKEFSNLAKDKRERVFYSLVKLALLLAALVTAISAGLFAMWLLWRFGMRQARSLKAAKLRLEAMIGTSLDAVIVTDEHLRITEFNGAAELIFGHSRPEAIGLPLTDLVEFTEAGSPLRIPAGQGLVQRNATRRTGSSFPAELSITATEIGSSRGYVSFLRDISLREAARRELIHARDKARQGERAKAAFVAVMSHELRTPLNGLLGTLELLRDTPLTDRQTGYVDAMEQSGQILMHHVNDVLDVERLDAGKLPFDNLPYRPDDLVRKIVAGQRDGAAQRGNKIEIEVIGPRIGQLMGDPVRVRQILVNLIGNAVKFTRNGLIRIELERDEAAQALEIRVIDTGIGIARADIGRIFDDFISITQGVSDDIKGTGLGLGIVRRLVEAMGGTIGVESEIGEGSVFWVTLPGPRAPANFNPVTAPRAPQPLAPPEKTLDLLVVEDNPLNRTVLREMLMRMGHRVREAENGQEGVDQAMDRNFDVILMDLNMPVLNGLDATRRIRETPGPNQHSRIIAVTANVLPEAVDNLLGAGCDQVISKPITRAGLMNILAPTGERSVEIAPPPAPALLDDETRKDLETTFGTQAFDDLENAFLLEGRERLETLKTLVEQGDIPEYGRLAHRFAGSAAIIGIAGLHASLKDHENRAKAGDVQWLRDHYTALTALWSETEQVLGRKAG